MSKNAEEVKINLPPIHMAKVYLHQAQATNWRHWKMWLLEAAAKYRREQLKIYREHYAVKIELPSIDKHGQWSLL